METWLLIVIIAASVLVVGVIVWFLFLRSKDEDAAVQIVDLGDEAALTLAAGEVAYAYLTHEALEDAAWTFGECEVAEIEVVEKEDVPFPEEDGEKEEKEEGDEEEEEEERRLREEDGEKGVTSFFMVTAGEEAGKCKLNAVYTAEDLESFADAADLDEDTYVPLEIAVEVTEAEGEGEEKEEKEGDEEEEEEEEE